MKVVTEIKREKVYVDPNMTCRQVMVAVKIAHKVFKRKFSRDEVVSNTGSA